MDMRIMNEMAEVAAGIRKEKPKLVEMAEQMIMCQRGIDFIKLNASKIGTEMLAGNMRGLKEATETIRSMLANGEATQLEVDDAMAKAQDVFNAQDADRRAVLSAWAKENPGSTTMSAGGPEHQRLYDKVAAKPPSALDETSVDKRSCAWCGKAAGAKLLKCSGCAKAHYCNRECQKAAWKGHKAACMLAQDGQPGESIPAKAPELPLTWEQLEVHGAGICANGKVLEVRIMEDQSVMRQVFLCKDRVGVVRRIAAYTDSGRIPKIKVGKILRWTNPRFHFFMDGSSGARIEETDLVNIKVKSQ
eukprot:TRINITY_DN24078_c0_g1_i1.p1 TRINITY_DN24078_c0_g1~~TRINITY_DN24078_c0_g1_i1.p1  ORF type:complete len:355 (-),score=46.98 TRINITY_DN24078_c0_g1_i1:59-970(-)